MVRNQRYCSTAFGIKDNHRRVARLLNGGLSGLRLVYEHGVTHQYENIDTMDQLGITNQVVQLLNVKPMSI